MFLPVPKLWLILEGVILSMLHLSRSSYVWKLGKILVKASESILFGNSTLYHVILIF